MKKLWFKNKRYGWGWTPATLEGYLVLIMFFGFEILNAIRLNEFSNSNSSFARPFVIETFLAVLIILFITYKTGEKPGWHWGKDK